MTARFLGILWCVAAALGPTSPALAQNTDTGQMRPYDEMRAEDRNARPVIAVEEFHAGGNNGEVVAHNMRALLITALRRDGRFAVPRFGSGVQTNDADIYIEGTVTRYQTSPAGRDLQSADVEISLRVIDAASGRTIGTVSANGTGTGGEAVPSHPMDAETFSTTGLGRAGEVALRMAVPKIAEVVRRAGDRPNDQ